MRYEPHIFIPTNAILDKPLTIEVMVFARTFLTRRSDMQIESLEKLGSEILPSVGTISSGDFLKNLIKLNSYPNNVALAVDELAPDFWSLHRNKYLRNITMKELKTQKLLDKYIDFHYARHSVDGKPVLAYYSQVKIIEINEEDYFLGIHKGVIKKFSIDKIYLYQDFRKPNHYKVTLANIHGGIYVKAKAYEEDRPIEKLLPNGVDKKPRKVYVKKPLQRTLHESEKTLNSTSEKTTVREKVNHGLLEVSSTLLPSTDSVMLNPGHALLAITHEQAQAFLGKEMKIQTMGGQTITLTATGVEPALHEQIEIKEVGGYDS